MIQCRDSTEEYAVRLVGLAWFQLRYKFKIGARKANTIVTNEIANLITIG